MLTCVIHALVRWVDITATSLDLIFFLVIVVGFAQTGYFLEEQTNPHQLSVKVLSPPQSIIELTGITFTATDGTAISKFHNLFVKDYLLFLLIVQEVVIILW